MIGNLCIRPDGSVNDRMYEGLTRRYSLDDALNMAEIDNVSRSWRDATNANLELRRRQEEKGRA